MAIKIPGFPRKNILKRNEDNIVLAAAVVTLAGVVWPWIRTGYYALRMMGDPRIKTAVNEAVDDEIGARPFRQAAK